MSTSRERLLQQFRELVLERLEKINRFLVELEAGPDLEAGKATLRELHGLKGEARMMGFPEVNAIVHQMEELVRAAEQGGYSLASASTDALLVASDAVKTLSGAGGDPEAPPEVPRVLEWLAQRAAAELALRPAPALPSAPAPPSRPEPPESAPRSASRPAPDARDGSVRIPQATLELLTSNVTGLVQRNRQRELVAGRRFKLVRELQALHRLAEDLGPSAATLTARLASARELAAELHRDGKLLANEELRDLSQLSEEVQTLRMIPLAVLFEAYPRMVRDTARDLGREVELVVDGEDTRVDRSVLEALKEPLMHLVRNAIDHGLEPRDERVEADKPPRGKLTLTALREGERLLLIVEDDGRGIDPAALRAAAVRKGLLSAEQAAALSDAGATELIFRAGFSSKEEATDLSGRGVGLDVVRVRVVSVGGEVTVQSTLGVGTRFELRVPVTLTVAPLLFVQVGDERLCLTASNVRSAARVEAGNLKQFAGRPALDFGQGSVPFGSLASMLGAAPARPATEGELILLIEGRGQTAAIAVDRVLEERVQAVLPLKGMLTRLPHLAGATPLADGTLAMVLSAAHLVALAQGREASLAGAPRASAKRKRRILVVDDSPLTRELLVSLLEGVGYEILSANDGQEALELLAHAQVDMVVTDLEMPRVDGLALTQRLKNDPTLKALPVAIVTTRGSDSDRRRGMEAGADAYITKSDLVRQDLVDVVSRLLA